jgi:transketolase
MNNKNLKKRILEISYKHNLSHLGSCLTAVDIIDEIYAIKKHNERFVLSSGHAGLALYVVIEKYTKGDDLGMVLGINAEDIFNHHGVHPDRCSQCGLDASTGSLGQGLPIAVGMALADRSKNVYCLISDGECSEGSVWGSFEDSK